jgi:hypothetical protein
MNSNRRREIINSVLYAGTRSAKAKHAHNNSLTGKKVQQRDQEEAQRILAANEKFDVIEDMIVFEQALQKGDFLKATSNEDRNSIRAAQRSYEQLSKTIAQMRKTPDAYFEFVMGHKDTRGDPRKIVKGNSLDFIAGNITRMQNRKQFVPESEKEVWDARIAMAKKTIDMFKTLHDNLAANFIRKTEMRTKREAEQDDQQSRTGKGRT